jgi:hypothetical protein
MRKSCKECPWTKNNPHSKSWPSYVDKIEKIGKIKNKKHACHMITSDTWGYKTEINEKNACIGSLKNESSL